LRVLRGGIYWIYMNTRVIFNTDKKLKEAAMRKAKRQGLTLSAFLNIATRAFVEDELELTVSEQKRLVQARKEIRQGKVFTEEEVLRRFNIKLS